MVHYLVLGAGMQGAAGAYDLARCGGATALTWVDSDAARLAAAAERVRGLQGSAPIETEALDAGSPAGREHLSALLARCDVCFNALPYRFAVAVTELALGAGKHVLDLGGNTDVALAQLALAKRHPRGAGLCVLPDCGLQPGMGNLFAAYALAELGPCHSIRIRCGGLPERPRPPLDYMLVFSVEGLTNEYFGRATVLRGGERREVRTFTELEEIHFAGLPPCEAFITSGGLSTTPWTLAGRVRELDYKTVRYRGHHARFQLLLDLGLLDPEPIDLDGRKVAPREVLHAQLRKTLTFPGERDLVVLRCEALAADRRRSLRLEVLDVHDAATGFSAMERTTAFSAAACAEAVALGKARPGLPLELAVDPRWFVEALERRGIRVEIERGERAA